MSKRYSCFPRQDERGNLEVDGWGLHHPVHSDDSYSIPGDLSPEMHTVPGDMIVTELTNPSCTIRMITMTDSQALPREVEFVIVMWRQA